MSSARGHTPQGYAGTVQMSSGQMRRSPGLRKRFGAVNALDRMRFTVGPGQMTSFMILSLARGGDRHGLPTGRT